MNRRHTILAVFLILIGLQACRVPKELNPVKPIETPGTYYVDSAYRGNQGMVIWREYFKDPALVSLIDTAISHNLDMKIANQRIFAAYANLSASRNYLFPQITTAAWVGVTRYGDYTQNGVGNFDTNKSPNISADQIIPNPVPDYYVGLQAGWETGLWGKLQNRKRGQYNRFLATVDGRRLLTTRLVADVASLYYDLLTLDTELEIIRRNIIIQEKAVELIHVQKESGRISELGVKQFEAQLLRFQGLERVRMQDVVATENALNTLLGRYPGGILRKDTIDISDLPPMLTAGVPAALLQNRPDVQQAEKEFIAGNYELKSARAAFYPSIMIRADAGMNAFKSSLWFQSPASFAFDVLGGLSAPLVNRVQFMAAYRRAYAIRNEAWLNYQKSVLVGVAEVSTEMNRVLNFQRTSELKAREVRTMIEAVSISNDLFLAGYANYMEVLIARQNRLESELQLTETRRQQFLSAIFLYRSLGGGWQ
jgi:outer membrane protein, multidrug efflux system